MYTRACFAMSLASDAADVDAFSRVARSSATSVRRTWMVSPACSVALSRPGPISLRMDARCPVLVGVSTWLPAPCAAHSAASDWRRDCCCPRLGVRGVVPVPPVGAPGDVKSGESRGVWERLGGVELGMRGACQATDASSFDS